MRICSAFFMLFFSLFLQGCIGIAAVSGFVATKTVTDPRSVGTQVDDKTLEIRVSNAIRKDHKLSKEARILATVYQGKVLLTGQAPTSALVNHAKKIAISISGTTKIYNEIRKGIPISIGTASMDIWITTKIRFQFLTTDTVKSSNVKVITENGETFLLGLVTQREGYSAAEIASKVSGVKHVTTAFIFLK